MNIYVEIEKENKFKKTYNTSVLLSFVAKKMFI